MINDLVKIKMLAVDQRGIRRAMSQDLGVDVAPGVDAHGRGLDQSYGSYGQQIRRPWTSTDEVDAHSTAFIELHCTTARAGRQP